MPSRRPAAPAPVAHHGDARGRREAAAGGGALGLAAVAGRTRCRHELLLGAAGRSRGVAGPVVDSDSVVGVTRPARTSQAAHDLPPAPPELAHPADGRVRGAHPDLPLARAGLAAARPGGVPGRRDPVRDEHGQLPRDGPAGREVRRPGRPGQRAGQGPRGPPGASRRPHRRGGPAHRGPRRPPAGPPSSARRRPSRHPPGCPRCRGPGVTITLDDAPEAGARRGR